MSNDKNDINDKNDKNETNEQTLIKQANEQLNEYYKKHFTVVYNDEQHKQPYKLNTPKSVKMDLRKYGINIKKRTTYLLYETNPTLFNIIKQVLNNHEYSETAQTKTTDDDDEI